MSNVFRRLISKELGEANYHRYFSSIKKSLDTKKNDSQAIYNDMYEKLKYRDLKSITKMHNRLNDTMVLAFRISKNFSFTFIFYLIASVSVIIKVPQPALMILALILISACFLYKAYEFVANKFCYIDAQIILVYKAVLDRIILNERNSTRNNS
jgi:hypothetical protein